MKSRFHHVFYLLFTDFICPEQTSRKILVCSAAPNYHNLKIQFVHILLLSYSDNFTREEYFSFAFSSVTANSLSATSGNSFVNDEYLVWSRINSLKLVVGAFESSVNGFFPSALAAGLNLSRFQYTDD